MGIAPHSIVVQGVSGCYASRCFVIHVLSQWQCHDHEHVYSITVLVTGVSGSVIPTTLACFYVKFFLCTLFALH